MNFVSILFDFYFTLTVRISPSHLNVLLLNRNCDFGAFLKLFIVECIKFDCFIRLYFRMNTQQNAENYFFYMDKRSMKPGKNLSNVL